MADATRELQIVVSAKDEAKGTLSSIGSGIKSLADDALVGSTAILGAFSLMGKGAIDAGSQLEQARIAFNTMIGDTKLAGKTLTDLSDFAAKTPFTFPGIVDASQRLLAYNVQAKDLIPTLNSLGNIAAGVGTDKMPQLVLAFGQVKAATHLTGAELRQFSEAGVPLLQTLVDQFNASGKASMGMSTSIVKGTKMSAESMTSLQHNIDETKAQLSILNNEHVKAGAATDKHNLAIMRATNNLSEYQSKLSGANKTVTSFGGATKVTAAQVQDMISKGQVSFDDVQKALTGMSSSGGKFFDLMDKQSKTFSGVMSNISDNLFRVGAALVGVSISGEVLAGGVFDKVSQGANAVLDVLNKITPQVSGFMQMFLNNQTAIAAALGGLLGLLTPLLIAFVAMIAPALAFAAAGIAIGAAVLYVYQQLVAGNPLFWGLVGALTALALVITASLIPAFIAWTTQAIATGIAVTLAFGPIGIVIVAIGIAVGLLAAAWNTNFLGIRDSTKQFTDWLGSTAWPRIQSFGEQFKAMGDLIGIGWTSRMDSIKRSIDEVISTIKGMISVAEDLGTRAAKGLHIPGFQHGGFVPGGAGDAVPAILHGGERVVPRSGVDVNNGGGGGGANVTVNFNGSMTVDSDSRVQELAEKIINILGRQNELAAKGLSI